MKNTTLILTSLALTLITLNACKKDNINSPNESSGINVSENRQGDNSVGAVYTMENAAAGNNILVYSRASDGTLTSAGSFSTGGLGTGGGLGSQGAIVLNSDNSYLYACNAGSNEVTAFSVNGTSLTWVDKVSSRGTLPISVTSHGNLLYVLNAGGTGSISGFLIGADGHLSPLAGSDRALSGNAVGPAQIAFNDDGTQLVVTEKATNLIDTYSIDANGLAATVISHPSAGNTPFGFGFGKNSQLIVSDAFGGMPGASAVSSYTLSSNGTLNLITGPVATTQTAACWVAVTNDGRFCYCTNTGSASVTGYSISNSGALTLLNPTGVSGVTGTTPIDVTVSRNSKFLYTLNSAGHSISMFHINNDGGLTQLGNVPGLIPGTIGIAAQ